MDQDQDTQTYLERQKNVEDSQKTNAADLMMSSKNQQHKPNLNNQILSISRLIANKKNPETLLETYLPSTALSSDMNADKWIKACTSEEKGTYAYQTFSEPMKDSRKSYEISDTPRNSRMPIYMQKRSSIDPSPLRDLLGDDSLEDVLPMQKPTDYYDKIHVKHQHINHVTVDAVTSDPKITRTRESKLQTGPNICEIGTFTNNTNRSTDTQAACPLRSAGVLTSKCVLPASATCNYAGNSSNGTDTACRFIYGEPVCAVHRQSYNADVQTTDLPLRQSVVHQERRDSLNSDARVLSLAFGMLPQSPPQRRSNIIGEVLSPKVS
ncbi:uncharacterized protein LOC142973247 [Anticarsia gemmatalis]|uniref:uncharacterized protein LOC142973247 n=1 Tax=Anticarsia gemmatalis TaxID=129554 RepID=UPI003F76522A